MSIEPTTDEQRDSVAVQRLVRHSVEELKSIAAARCLCIYDDFTAEEIYQTGRLTSLVMAWEVGAALRKAYMPNDEMRDGERKRTANTTDQL